MPNEGLLFEWAIIAVASVRSPNAAFKKSILAQSALVKYKTATATLKKAAESAVTHVEDKYGPIMSIEKLSGGVEPKTDLYITTKRGKFPLKCSLKYGASIQLSSGGVASTVKFLSGILLNLKTKKGFDSAQVTKLLSTLMDLENLYGSLGKLPQHKAKALLDKGSAYGAELQSVLGGSHVTASETFADIKLAIIEEAITGKYTFANDKKRSADHILSEKSLLLVDKKLIQTVSDKTTVRLALKGRGKQLVGDKIIRMNEIVIRFDTKA